jgi:hypothetical protein
MKFTVLACALVWCCTFACGQELQKQCGVHPNVLRSNSGALRWFSSQEMEGFATKTVAANPVELPGHRQYQGFVAANVMIDISGEIVCLWDVAGHPVMIPSAIRAMHEWKFRPMTVGGRKVEFVGRLRILVRSTS